MWRYVPACQWRRVFQEEAFVDRCAPTGDRLGARPPVGAVDRFTDDTDALTRPEVFRGLGP